jgi:hypothetical protein
MCSIDFIVQQFYSRVNMPEPIILDNISFQANLPALMKQMRLKPGSAYARQFEVMAQEAQAIARPKAFFKLAFIDSLDENHVVMDGVPFTSRVLSRNLAQTHRVIPYLVTCGLELDEWGHSFDDILPRYWAEALMEHAMHQANRYLDAHLQHRYKLGRTSSMHPGSLADWPITQQRALFTLLGDSQAAIGVTLTQSMLMLPTKSVSGLRFSVNYDFETCNLCPRENCPSRRAPYDQEQVAKYLGD